MNPNEQDLVIAAAVQEERDRISRTLDLSIGLYGGFYPAIAEALLGILKDVDEEHYEKTLAIYNKAKAKLND
jgi:hypothetical protein